MGIEITPAVVASGVTIEAVGFANEVQPDGSTALRLLLKHVVTDADGNRILVDVTGVAAPPDLAAALDAFLNQATETAAKTYDISPVSVTAMPPAKA